MNYSDFDKKWFLRSLENKELVKKIYKVNVIITDIDGSLTDGQLSIASIHGENKYEFSKSIAKNFSVQDGFAIANSIKNDLLKIVFLTGRTDEATNIRAEMLGIPKELCFIGVDKKKREKVDCVRKSLNFLKEEILYFGDDFLDFEVRDSVGLMCCPENTPFYFQEVSDLVVPREASNSCFRLLIDFVLFVQEKHFAQDTIKRSLENRYV